jgi:hypothetical protein
VLSTKAVFIRADDREIEFEAVMASMVSVSILGGLALAALVWCFLGFTRALHEPPKFAGWLVQPQQNFRNGRNSRVRLLEFPLFPANHTSAAGQARREKIRKNQ